MMRSGLLLFMMLGLVAGCASRAPEFLTPGSEKTETPEPSGTITEIITQVGRVVSVNSEVQFVVIEFPLGDLPAVGTRAHVYRNSQKVGTLRISGPHQNLHTVGDITEGRIQVGDEVRMD